MVEDFDRRISQIPSDLCSPFHAEAGRLEIQLLTIYQMVATIARKLDDLSEIASLWGSLVDICDIFAGKLEVLHTEHPYCGADSYYDKVLDLRNKCQRLQKMHQ